MKKSPAIAALSAIIIAGAALIWFLYRTKTSSVEQSPQRQFAIAITKNIVGVLPIIACEKHFFEKEGLNVRYSPFYASGKETFDAMLAGAADISIPATLPVVLKSFERSDYSIFLVHTTNYHAVKIIARKDRKIFSAADLKGKTIGYASRTISQMTLDSLISYKKILGSEITLRDYPPLQLTDAVLSGSVDAISVWEPIAGRTRTMLGTNATDVPTENVYRSALTLTATNAFIAGNHASLVKMIRAMDRAASFIGENREEAQKIISDILDMDIETVREIWDDYKHGITLDQELIITMENEAEWAIQTGLTQKKKVPNYLHYVYTEALEEYKPEAMTLIK